MRLGWYPTFKNTKLAISTFNVFLFSTVDKDTGTE
ncbi:hypothetical protein ES707_22090 [subsurface metagenome]